MSRRFADAADVVRVPPLSGSEPFGPLYFNHRALRAATALAGILHGSASAFVAPPLDRPRPTPAAALSLVDRIRVRLRPGAGPDGDPRPEGSRAPRLMPTDAGRHVNAMPGHAMAAGGRPLIMKIPGR